MNNFWIRVSICAVFISFFAAFPEKTRVFDYEVIQKYAGYGESLLHGIQSHPLRGSGPSWYPPLPTVSAALLLNHSPVAAESLWAVMQITASATLVFVPAYLLAGPLAGTAALLLLFTVTGTLSPSPIQAIYGVILLMIAAVLIWRSRAPSWKRSVLAALVLGSSLLCRSLLFFFPLFLCLWEFLVIYKGSWRASWKNILPLCTLPYLFLLPWMGMSQRLNRQPLPYEALETHAGLVSAGKGLLPCVYENYWRLGLEGAPAKDAAGPVLRWFAQEFSSSPWKIIKAYFKRLAYGATLQPFLFFLCLAALYGLRRNKDGTPLVLLFLYCVAALCLFGVTDGSWAPLWPLLCAVAATLVSKQKPGRNHWAIRVIGIWLVPLLVLSLFSLCLSSAYPYRKETFRDFPELSGQDAWMLSQRGAEHLSLGRAQKAQELLEAAKRLQPKDQTIAILLSASYIRQKEWQKALEALPTNTEVMEYRVQAGILHALTKDLQGDAPAAREEIRRTWKLFHDQQAFLYPLRGSLASYFQTELERRADASMRRAALPLFVQSMETLLKFWPSGEGVRLLKEMALLNPDSVEFDEPLLSAYRDSGDFQEYLKLARLMQSRHSKRENDFWFNEIRLVQPRASQNVFLLLLDIVEKRGDISASQRHEIALYYQDALHLPAALKILRSLVKEKPENAVFWKDKGIAEFLAGYPETALKDLRRSMLEDPGLISAHLSAASVCVALKRYEEAGRILAQGLRAEPKNSAAWKERAQLQRLSFDLRKIK